MVKALKPLAFLANYITFRFCAKALRVVALSLGALCCAPVCAETESLDIGERYAQATAALAADDPARARELLEAIVADRPEFAGARLDLALAAYRSGDTEAGLEHLDYLRSHFILPGSIASQVDYWYQRWQSPAPTKPNAWQGDLTLSYGRDSNVNAGLATNSLTLSFPGGNVAYPLDRSAQPYADNFYLLALNAWGPAHAIALGKLTPVIQLRNKRLNEQSDYDSIDINAGAIYLQPAENSGSWRIAGFLQYYQLGGKTINTAFRLSTLRMHPWGACQLSGGGELETRQAKDLTDMGGGLLSVNAGLSCPLPGEASISSLLRAGYTRPRDDWPGGSKTGLEFALQYNQPLGASRRFEATWRYSQLNDSEGYSPLLENNATRRLKRNDYALTLRQEIGTGWEALLSIEHVSQNSNLPLFEYQGSLLMLGLTKRY